MADLTFTGSNTPPLFFARLKDTLGRAFQGLRDGILAHDRYRELSLMSDRQLADIGLDRSEIGREAMFPAKYLPL